MNSETLSLETISNKLDLLKKETTINETFENRLLATKLIENIGDPSNAKESYHSYLKRRNRKLVTRSKIIALDGWHILSYYKTSKNFL